MVQKPFLRNRKLDDVVGAVSVHGVAGAWGTVCAGLFYKEDMFNGGIVLVQLIGVGACFVWTFTTAYATYFTVNKLGLLRVDALEEQRGLDFTEHAEVAYPEFIEQTVYSKETLDKVER